MSPRESMESPLDPTLKKTNAFDVAELPPAPRSVSALATLTLLLKSTPSSGFGQFFLTISMIFVLVFCGFGKTGTAIYEKLGTWEPYADGVIVSCESTGVSVNERQCQAIRFSGQSPDDSSSFEGVSYTFRYLDPGEEVAIMDRWPNDDARGDYKKEDIWPEGRIPEYYEKQCLPYLEWHFPKERKTDAIQIIYSGGGYYGNDPDGFEVVPARRFLNEKGMTVVTIKYRTPRSNTLAKHTSAWQDLQRAIRIVRSEAASYGLDPDRIGIMGSSAGGHLTLMGVTSSKHMCYHPVDQLDKLSCKVQWGIGIYPAYALTDGIDEPNKNGGNEDDAVFTPEFSFDLDTAPMLFVHGDKDGWASMNSVKVWEKMRAMGIQSELHTLALRPHCFQRTASPGTGSYTYLDRIWEFMTAKGFNK